MSKAKVQVVSRKPKTGTVVGVPLGNGETGAMIYLSSFPIFGDAYGLMRGAWSEQQICASDWNPPVFPSPIFTGSKYVHESKWHALGSRPDLIGRFYRPEGLHHPSHAHPSEPSAPAVKSKPKSLAELKHERFFSSWKGFVPAAAIRKAEVAVQEAIESLDGKSPAQAARRLATLVRTFNKLDFDKGTIERETIMDAVEVLASACGVDAEEIDDERDF